MKMYLILLSVLFISCGDNSFLSGGSTNPAKPGVQDQNQNNSTPKTDDLFQTGDPNKIAFGDGSSENNSDLNGGNGDSNLNLTDKCWFAVSGAYFGCHTQGSCTGYQSVFPETTSGNPIAHGETFDTVGGTYLNSSEVPYEYGKGGGEIDAAVNSSFDSIAIAPGMEVEIRDAAGTVLLKESGPLLRLSSEYGGDISVISYYFISKQDKMPAWMKKAFVDSNWKPQRMALHSARWVKVTKTPGVPCE